MTDLVHWRERACGEQVAHRPHAYFAGETFVCPGVTPSEQLAMAIRSLGVAITVALTPALQQAVRAGVEFDKQLQRIRKMLER